MIRFLRGMFEAAAPGAGTRARMPFLSLAAKPVQAREYEVILVAPEQNGFIFPSDVLARDAGFFDGATVFCDHTDLDEFGLPVSHPSARRVVGVISNPHVENGHLLGTLHVSPGADWLVALLDFCIELRTRGLVPPDVGMSADISFFVEGQTVTQIYRAWSVDVVFDPAAGGDTILRALNSGAPSLEQNSEGGEMLHSSLMNIKFWRQTFAFDADTGGAGGGGASASAPVTAAPVAAAPAAQSVDLVAQAQRQADKLNALLRAQCANYLQSALNASTLPEIHRAVIRERFENQIFDVAELERALEQQKRIHADYVARSAVTNIARPDSNRVVNGMWSDVDRLQMAVNRLLIPFEFQDNALRESDVQRLRGVQELYLLVSGDREFRGHFVREHVQFANATTTTMAALVAVAYNKVIAAKWAQLQDPYGWFHRVTAEHDFTSLNTANWITVGGFGDIPTVPEGAAYTEVVWDDNVETSTWLKKGGYLALTIEMMDRDQTEKVKQVPVALATAGIRTLSAAVASILTTNGNLADGTALFHSTSTLRGGDGSTAASGNLSTTALSAAEWDVHIQKTYKKQELNSGRALGLRPKYRIVPIDLEKTSLTIGASAGEPGTPNNDANVRADSDSTVVCPEFTDATDWYSVVDPRIYPCLGVGYRYGRTPEVFTAGEETQALMFFNDALAIKVRYFFTTGAIDWRGLRRATV